MRNNYTGETKIPTDQRSHVTYPAQTNGAPLGQLMDKPPEKRENGILELLECAWTSNIRIVGKGNHLEVLGQSLCKITCWINEGIGCFDFMGALE